MINKTYCSSISFGSYHCYEMIPELNICVDKCLVNEIKELNNIGIQTIGCCCGHGKLDGYIQVDPKYIQKMKKLGYEQQSLDENGNGLWCFKPKSIN